LKNILLVMADGGYLVPPARDPSKEELWVETRKRLGRFLPDLFLEIFPETAKESEKSRPSSALSSAQQPDETEKASVAEQKSEDNVPQPDSGDVEAVNTGTHYPEGAEEGT
jgi:brefeldin A-resistance guanine nucleotide exchange factor 1